MDKAEFKHAVCGPGYEKYPKPAILALKKQEVRYDEHASLQLTEMLFRISFAG